MTYKQILSVIALALAMAGTVDAEPAWPEFVDIDLDHRNSAPFEDDKGWDIRLGLGLEQEPTFQGSDKTELEPDLFAVLAYRANWGNVFLSGDGLGYSRMLSDDFGILLQLEAEDTREVEDDDRLRGLESQEEELELEIVGKYFSGPWHAGASLALATGDKGIVWFLGGGYTWRLANDKLFLRFKADLSGSNEENQQTDFGITATESANSVFGYPEYSPGGGLKSFGLRFGADYRINDRWFVNGEVELERLLGDVADSPLVTMGGSENNYEIGLGIYYMFR